MRQDFAGYNYGLVDKDTNTPLPVSDLIKLVIVSLHALCHVLCTYTDSVIFNIDVRISGSLCSTKG